MKRLRNYSGAPLPLPLQMAAAEAWAEESHVAANRALYAAKFEAARAVLPDAAIPEAGFFLWLPVPAAVGCGEAAAVALWRDAGVKVLPGAYLARDAGAGNPGRGFVRAALVGPLEETVAGLTRLRERLYGAAA